MMAISLPCLASSDAEDFSYSSFLPTSCSPEYAEGATNVLKKNDSGTENRNPT
jgi:hypothetical protein